MPQEGDDVEVPSGWNLVLDLEETPVFNSLTINGRLSFAQNGMDVHLRSKYIFVRAGELFIGSAEAPFENQARITLHGNQDDETLAFSGAVSAGNKILATVGDVAFYGMPRSRQARLQAPVYRGGTEILVDEGLDWGEGDEIYIAPTAMQYEHSEYRKIRSYANGLVTLDEALDHYHWGAGLSTAADYNGVDMRGEVILLTRNVKVVGEDADGWGGQILATDLMEASGAWRAASLTLDNVEVDNCSQRNTHKAAIRFEGALAGTHSIRESVVHNSLAWSVSVLRSRGVQIDRSAFVGSRAIGVHIDYANSVAMRDSFTGDVMPRELTAGDQFVDKEGCVAVCSYLTQGRNACNSIEITGNTAAGCKFGGFIAPGHDCGETDSVTFRDNVAHSTEGAGAYIYPNPAGNSHAKCYEGSHFAGYKNTLQCVVTHYPTTEMRMRDLTCIDNGKGVNLQTAGDNDDILIKLSDSAIYGETEALDCPDRQECWCNDKFGFMLFGNNFGGK